MQIILIASLGVVGVLSRYGIDVVFGRLWSQFPWLGTLAINMIGCFVAGYLSNLEALKASNVLAYRHGLLVGFCGGFTTFSAYGLHSMRMLDGGQWANSLIYIVSSNALGLLMVFMGQRWH